MIQILLLLFGKQLFLNNKVIYPITKKYIVAQLI